MTLQSVGAREVSLAARASGFRVLGFRASGFRVPNVVNQARSMASKEH